MHSTKIIAVLGGTGKEGKGLAYRWAKSGYPIIIGSRSKERAIIIADQLSRMIKGNVKIEGNFNLIAAQSTNTVVITVPYSAHRETLEQIKPFMRGKLLIDVTVPLVPPDIYKIHLPPAGSAAQEAREILGPDVDIASAFQNISYQHLLTNEPIDCDVLVTGTSKEARLETLDLVHAAGLVGWDAGPIENSAVVEGMTSILIGINKNYGSKSVGFRITGIKSQTGEL